jgi:hypothetical protein
MSFWALRRARGFAPTAAVAALAGAAGAAALLPSGAGAQYFGRNKVQYEAFDFRVLRTPHFDLHYYAAESLAAADAGRQAERWYLRHETTLGHVFDRRPLVVYANIPDFLQTNVTQIGDESTGGVTTGARERVVYRFTGVPADDDHVLGHELVHVFQYDIALSGPRGLQSLGQLPLWLIEGMAEYLSVGRDDPATAVWLRDAVLRNRLPTLKQLTNDRRFFPYRYGQAFWAFVGARYGDQRVNEVFRMALRVGQDLAIKRVLGVSSDSLSKLWKAQIKADYAPLVAGRTLPRDAGRRVLTTPVRDGQYNLGPALSPDGRYVALFASRDLFGIELFLADAATGKVVRKLTDVTTDDHLDAVSFLYSAGSFSPDGREFAYVVYAEGRNELRIVDVRSGRQRRVPARGIDAMTTLAWSPDGRSIAIAGQAGAQSDLFLLDVASGAVRALTDDQFADLQPAWSPDGRTLAFASDRPGTDFRRLSYQPMQVSLLEVATGAVRTLAPFPGDTSTAPRLTAGTQAINPQFSPDGRSVYFVSDRGGFQDVYRTELASGAVFQVTRLATGVTGVAALSPALTVARQSGRVMFSVFERQGYHVYGLDSAQAAGQPVAPATPTLAAGGTLPPVAEGGRGLVSLYLRTPQDGLPPADTAFASRDYAPRLAIEAIGQPSIGVGTSSFGTLVGGSTSAYFTDLLGNRNLAVGLQANGTLKDIGGQLQYFNVAHRLQWGGSVGRIPYLTGFSGFARTDDPDVFVYQQVLQRVYIDQLSGTLQYPLSVSRRVELNPGITRYSYSSEIQETPINGFGQQIGETRRRNASEFNFDPVTAGQVGVAYVGDNAFTGFTSPIAGQRYRFEVTPTLGTLNYQTALADYRRYLFARPVTFAMRGVHFGRYGKDENDPLLYPLYLGQGTLVRGYEYNSVINECARTASLDNGCPVYSRLIGNRVALASAEVRIPVLGTEQLGLLRSPVLPLEVAPFVDAGVAWSQGDTPTLRFDRTTDARVPVVSTGVAFRTNLLGFAIVEAYYAYPFQRPGEGGHWGFNLAPGW